MGRELIAFTKSAVAIPQDSEALARLAREIALLMIEATRPSGSHLEAGQLADAIEAVRNGRVFYPKRQEVAVILEECDDWSDLTNVSIHALGLKYTTVDKCNAGGIHTVGELILFPLRRRAGLAHCSGTHLKDLKTQVEARGYVFAEDCAGVPLALIRRQWGGNYLKVHRFFDWPKDEIDQFVEGHRLVTLGDLAGLTREALEAGYIPSAGRLRLPDEATPEQRVNGLVFSINCILKYYSLPEIATE